MTAYYDEVSTKEDLAREQKFYKQNELMKSICKTLKHTPIDKWASKN